MQKLSSIAILLFLSYTPAFSSNVVEQPQFEPEQMAYVHSPKGLYHRNRPTTKTRNNPRHIPYGEEVRVIKAMKNNRLTIGGVEGYWVMVEYEAHIGYVFSGFISNTPILQASNRTAE